MLLALGTEQMGEGRITMPVYCKDESLKILGEKLYNRTSLAREIHLVIDAPWGYAADQFSEHLPRPAVIITGNPSPHYIRDLTDLKPEVLLVGPVTLDDMTSALTRASNGESYYKGPQLGADPLAPREREVLRLIAHGLETSEIAKRLVVSEGTVANWVTNLKRKLMLRNRVELALYYHGIVPMK